MNIVFISEETTSAQEQAIKAAIQKHNNSSFDQADLVEPEIVTGADFTCIGGENAGFTGEEGCGKGRESAALIQLFSGIVSIIRGEA